MRIVKYVSGKVGYGLRFGKVDDATNHACIVTPHLESMVVKTVL